MYLNVREAVQLPYYGLSGLGDAAAAAPGFVDGLMAWKSPTAAITAVKSAVSSPSTIGNQAAYLGGIVAAPLGALVLLSTVMGGRRRRR